MIYFLVCTDTEAAAKITEEMATQISGNEPIYTGIMDNYNYINDIESLVLLPEYNNYIITVNSFMLDFKELLDYTKTKYDVTIINVYRSINDILQFIDKDNIELKELSIISDMYYNAVLNTKYSENNYDFNTICTNKGFKINDIDITLSDDFTLTNRVTKYEIDKVIYNNFTDEDIMALQISNFIIYDGKVSDTYVWYLNSVLYPGNNTTNYSILDNDVELNIIDLLNYYKTNSTTFQFLPQEILLMDNLISSIKS